MQLTTSLAHRAKRARVQADIEAFLAGGGRIRQFPPGVTAERPAPCGYLRDLCREVLLGHKDEDPKSVTQVNRGASISGKKRWAVFKRDGYACVACGADSDLTIDHIHPQSKGGGNQFDNLQTLCRKCNTKKGASTNAV